MYLEKITSLKSNQKIALVGLGKELDQFLTWLVEVLKLPAEQIILADQHSENLDLGKYVAFEKVSGPEYLQVLKNAEVEYVFKAPGIWSLAPEFIEFRATKGQYCVLSSLIFFLEAFPDQIIAVTGTKGKSTTSSLVTEILNSQGLEAHYCGNTTGISPYSFWTSLTQSFSDKEVFVIEMSSFQLQDLGYARLSPRFSLITNYYLDHLDQHATKEEYWSAKDNIFLFQTASDVVVCNQQVLDISPNAQRLLGSGVYSMTTVQTEVVSQEFPTQLFGNHNQMNLGLAIEIAQKYLQSRTWLFDKEQAKHTLAKFTGLSHRLELVHQIKHSIVLVKRALELVINCYDDGYATEPDAVVAAVETLCRPINSFVWLQISGKDKGPDLSKLVETLSQNLQNSKILHIDFCGAVGQRLQKELEQVVPQNVWKSIEIHSGSLKSLVETEFSSFNFHLNQLSQQILKECQTDEQATLNVVLSPCGSSFDEFKNVTERSIWWVERVKEL